MRTGLRGGVRVLASTQHLLPYLAPRLAEGTPRSLAIVASKVRSKRLAGHPSVPPAVEPTQRGPRAPTSVTPPAGAPCVVPPRATGHAHTQAVLKALRGLGWLSEKLLGQVAKSPAPCGQKSFFS